MPPLTNYTGNAGLGIGSNPSVPVTTTGELDVINQTGRDIMLLNHENNVRLYNQKIKDRDNLYSLLSEDKASVGAMREEDRKIYNDAKTEANNAFIDLAKSGGVNNPEAMRKYKEKINNLNQVSTQAQVRYKLLGEEEQAIANETRPLIRQERQQNLEPQKQNFWGNYQPYQKAFDGDVNTMLQRWGGYGVYSGDKATVPTATTDISKVVNKDGKITATNVQKTAPVAGKQPLTGEVMYDEKGMPYRTRKGGRTFDWNELLTGTTTEYSDNKDFGAEDQRFLKQGIEALPAQQQQQVLGTILKKAQQYNLENGLVPDESGNFPEGAIDINRLRTQFTLKDPNDAKKGFLIGTSVPEFAALMTLAKQDRFTTPDEKIFDKDLASEMEKKRHNLATEAINKNKNALQWRKFHDAKAQQTEIQQVGKQKVTDLLNATKTTFFENDPLIKTGSNGYIDVTELPASRKFITGIVYKDGRPQIGELKPTTITLPNGQVRQIYNTTYYNEGGKKIDGAKDLSPELATQYTQFKQMYGKEGNWNNYLKALAKNGILTPQFEGEEGGAATVNSIMEGQRFEAAKAGKKGFENVYEQEEVIQE